MITCQKCGKSNSSGSNFCRFCGADFRESAQAPRHSYESVPPRPYAWKTDELRTQSEARNPVYAERVQPLADAAATGRSAEALAYSAPPGITMAYRCPHCLGQFLPVMSRRISTTGWIVFAILLVFFLPLFWIGLLIKEEVRICPNCKRKII